MFFLRNKNACLKLIIFVLVFIGYSKIFAKIEKVEKPAPSVAFFDHENQKIYLNEYEGQSVLLVFWASWCSACTSDLYELNILQRDFIKLPFKIIVISEDFLEKDIIKKYFQKQEIKYLEIFYDFRNSLFEEMSIAGLPTAFLIDPSGVIKFIFKGSTKWHDLDVRELILSTIPEGYLQPKNSYKPNVLIKNYEIENDDQSE